MENNLRLICIAIVMQPANGGQPIANSPWGEAPSQPQVTNQPPQPQPQVVHQTPQPQPQVMGSVNPQPMMVGSVNHQMNQGASPFNIPLQYAQSYKKIYANDWLIYGIVSCVISIAIPFLSGMCCFVSLIGIISIAPKLNIEKNEPGHPEAEKVKLALIANLVAIILPIIVIVVMRVSGFY